MTFVHVNDIFDIDVIKKRIAFAYNGVDSTGFWEKFFLCKNGCAQGGTVIYLFTYEQLSVLQDWWKDNIKEKSKAKRLEKQPGYQKNICIDDKENRLSTHDKSSNEHGRTPEEVLLSGLCVCQAEFVRAYSVSFKLLPFKCFIEEALERGRVDFFHKDFKRETTEAFEPRKRMLTFLEKRSKKHLSEELNGNYLIPDKKWLSYLSKQKLNFSGKIFGHQSLEYCLEAQPDCPLVQFICTPAP